MGKLPRASRRICTNCAALVRPTTKMAWRWLACLRRWLTNKATGTHVGGGREPPSPREQEIPNASRFLSGRAMPRAAGKIGLLDLEVGPLPDGSSGNPGPRPLPAIGTWTAASASRRAGGKTDKPASHSADEAAQRKTWVCERRKKRRTWHEASHHLEEKRTRWTNCWFSTL